MRTNTNMISITEKPWGYEELLASIEQPTTIKIMGINSNARNSLHYHKHKDEIVYCISGVGILQRNTDILKLEPGAHWKVERTVAHRIKAGADKLKVLEISIGKYDENDIFRMEDDYGRVK